MSASVAGEAMKLSFKDVLELDNKLLTERFHRKAAHYRPHQIRQLFCSVSPEARNGQEEDVVTMSPSLGMRDKEPVLIMRPGEQSLGVGVKVFISPASEADWQILQLNQSRHIGS